VEEWIAVGGEVIPPLRGKDANRHGGRKMKKVNVIGEKKAWRGKTQGSRNVLATLKEGMNQERRRFDAN